MEDHVEHASLKKTARAAGLLYVVIILCAGFSEGYVRSGLVVAGDAVATAGNIASATGLFRVAFASDLVAFLSDAAVSVLLYVLLRPVNKTLSLVAAAFRLLAHPAIAAVNLLNHLAPVLLLSGADYLGGFQADQLQGLSMLFLEFHRYGYLIGGAFFGVHCLLLGALLFKADYLPTILGVFLVVASVGYLAESFGNFLFPETRQVLSWVVAVPAVIAELSLCLWLLLKGVTKVAAAR